MVMKTIKYWCHCQIQGICLGEGNCKVSDRFVKEIISTEPCRSEFRNACLPYLSQGMIQLDLERLEKEQIH